MPDRRKSALEGAGKVGMSLVILGGKKERTCEICGAISIIYTLDGEEMCLECAFFEIEIRKTPIDLVEDSLMSAIEEIKTDTGLTGLNGYTLLPLILSIRANMKRLRQCYSQPNIAKRNG